MTQTTKLDRDPADQAGPVSPDAPSVRHSIPAAKVLVGVLALLLLAPTLLSLRGRSGADENRDPVPFPRLDAASVLDTDTYRQVDAALRDRLTLRRQVTRVVGTLGYDGLQTSLSSQVHVGEDGIPYLTDEFTKPCRTTFNVTQADARLRSWDEVARRSGKDLLFVIVPDKSTVMRDKLGWKADALMACADPVHQQTQAHWAGDVNGPLLTLWSQFAATEKETPGRVFQRGDSHWSYLGSMIFTREVLNRLVTRGQAPTELHGAPGASRRTDRPLEGDLYRLLGTPRTDKVANWVVRRKDVKSTSTTFRTPTGRLARTRTSTGPAGTPFVPGRTLVVHDSFYYNADLQMAPYFEQITVLHWDDFLLMAPGGTLPGFDRVIFESAQRAWPQRIIEHLPTPGIAAAITQELSKPASFQRP